eukprot:Nitzschia sp. Nitz4//scaffold398_size17708//14957//16657//NITZ4_008806-RA/size17708-processed-gene-0.18-mRNA-1//1//CDS//3329550312//6438//frame0
MTAATAPAKKNFEHNFNQSSQYSEQVIKTFEATFGKNYMSAGGLDTSIETAKLLAPVLSRVSNPRVLDVGCGIGGSAFFFASNYQADVLGVDINQVGIDMANQNMAADASLAGKGKCEFRAVDLTAVDCDFAPDSFDIIYSRDVILHLTDAQKLILFKKFQSWLKPGGMVSISDYCLGPKSAIEISPEFQTYMDTRGYYLLTPPAYKQLFVDAGFDADFCEAIDKQLWYCQMARKEVDRILLPGPVQDGFLAGGKTQADLEKLAKVYADKINMTLRGDRSYVMVLATKTPTFYKQRQEVADAYRQVSKQNFIMSCDGNVSCRASDDTFLITPSGVTIPDLTPDKVVLCSNSNGKAMPGESYKPSSESRLHDCIYRNRPDVGAIVHTHSIYACALACCRLPLPPAHYAVCELLQSFDFSNPNGGSTAPPTMADAAVKCAPYHTYGTKQLAEVTERGLGQNFAVLMANHGAIVVGADMETALYNAERLERECEIYWRCLQMQMVGPPKPLTLPEIQELQQRDETYGQDKKDVDDEEEGEDGPVPEAELLSDSSQETGSHGSLDEENED